MEPADLVDLVRPHLPANERIVADDPAVAERLGLAVGGDVADGAAGGETNDRAVGGETNDGGAGGVLLLSGEVAVAGRRGPTVLADAVAATRPGGIIAVAVPSAVHQRLSGGRGGSVTPGMTAADLDHLLAERGLDVLLLAGPGAAAGLAGREWHGREDLPDDRLPGLRDAGTVVLAVGRTPRTSAERSERFFASIAYKILAASVVCCDEEDRILLVFDTFKNSWTLPGGLVDAGESPQVAAIREALEEGGVAVETDDLLGVFAHPFPDRVQVIYAARPISPTPHPVPIHTHEVSQARWVDRSEANRLLNRDMVRRLDACLDHPGRTWQW